MKRGGVRAALAVLGVLALVAGLALVVVLLSARLHLAAVLTLAALGIAVLIYVSPRFYAWPYVVPGVLAALVFIVLPMAYTLPIGFTNYSADPLRPSRRPTPVSRAPSHPTPLSP